MLDAVSLAVLVLGAAVVVRRLSRRLVDPVDAMLALVALFLVTSKVFSVQFVLWLLPLLVLSRVPARRLVLVQVVGSAVWLLYAPWEVLGDRYLHWAHAAALARAGLVAWVLQRHDAARRRSSRGSPGAAATLGRPPVPVNRPALS